MTTIQDAIFNITSNPYERATLLYSCGAESGCMPIHQINGPATGYYQIEPNQGVTQSCANDPTCATAAFYSRWNVAGCTSQQGQLWQTDPTQAAYLAARCAEGGGSSAGNNIGAPYSQAQQQTGAKFAMLSLGGIAGQVGGAIGNCITNPLNCLGGGVVGDAGQIAGNAVGGQIRSTAIDTIKSLLTSDFIIRMLLIVGGLAIGVVSVSHLMGIEAAPVPVPV
jgi:hypothetical protein